MSVAVGPTRSEARRSGESNKRVWAAIPAAAPTATASVGDVPNAATGSDARATPMKIAGKIGPPRKPDPRLTA